MIYSNSKNQIFCEVGLFIDKETFWEVCNKDEECKYFLECRKQMKPKIYKTRATKEELKNIQDILKTKQTMDFMEEE